MNAEITTLVAKLRAAGYARTTAASILVVEAGQALLDAADELEALASPAAAPDRDARVGATVAYAAGAQAGREYGRAEAAAPDATLVEKARRYVEAWHGGDLSIIDQAHDDLLAAHGAFAFPPLPEVPDGK